MLKNRGCTTVHAYLMNTKVFSILHISGDDKDILVIYDPEKVIVQFLLIHDSR